MGDSARQGPLLGRTGREQRGRLVRNMPLPRRRRCDARTRNTIHPGPDGNFELVASAGTKLDAFDFLVPQRERIGDGTSVIVPPFYHERQVTGRNAPTGINAVFDYRNFWDGRAEHGCNGVDPFGWRNADAAVIRATSRGVEFVKIDLENASPASQAVGRRASLLRSRSSRRSHPVRVAE